MAHKHNRRRVRTHSRNRTLIQTFDISDNFSTSSDAYTRSSSSSSSSVINPRQLHLLPIIRDPSSSLASRHWHNRYTAWQNRDAAQKHEAGKIEAEQIKLFGGEPGDDVGLCYKMMEVFAGMRWVETVE